jgi:hypothetical protein
MSHDRIVVLPSQSELESHRSLGAWSESEQNRGEKSGASWVEKVKMPLSSDNPHEKYELVELLGEG